MKQKLAAQLSIWKQQPPDFDTLKTEIKAAYKALNAALPQRIELAMNGDNVINRKLIIAELQRIIFFLPIDTAPIVAELPNIAPKIVAIESPTDIIPKAISKKVVGVKEANKIANIRINAARLLTLLEKTRSELRSDTEAKTDEERAKLVAQIDRLDKDYQQYQKVIDEFEESGKTPGADFAKLLSSETLASELRAAKDSKTKVEKLLNESSGPDKINQYRRRLDKIKAKIENLLQLQAETWQKV